MFNDPNAGGMGGFLASRLDNWRAHPFQNIASTLFGGFVPGGGLAANALFNRYNSNNFNNAAQQTYDRGADQGNQAAQSGFDRPLGGALGGFDSSNNSGAQIPVVSYNGPTSNGSNWSYGQFWNGGNPTTGSSLADSILGDALNPNNVHGNPQARRDMAESGFSGGGNYGVSNFMVGGSPVIFGSGDPNGRYRNRNSQYGG